MLKNVLIVEDQQLVRAGMKAMLHLTVPHCRIVEAGSYAETLARLAETAFEVVFLDIDLKSEQSGLDLLARIRELGLPLRVIMLSALDDRDTILGCIAAGASGFIPKGSGDETVFERALSTVFSDGVFLPASVFGQGRCPPAPAPLSASDIGVSPRLCEALYYLCQGLPNKVIAKHMGISEGTIRKNYVSELLRFFKVARRTELIIEVARRGIRVPPPPRIP
ncbi:DNA-binding NarL/FixJ family response regulator [Paucibacter oligotrophus]|uniref:DNA-binding NarL/FixJ family response regulator n=1 Tax=Roseateles oligotrophus TaxID=1769250 RepID=A0A840LAX5_9BURK|nr:response regulator transcription factor [Roseateles oligotrophus]MBB4842507.1 DNA-binding NarL/FixJ family response regulator [Roseateles oligotrophus]